MPLSDWDKIWDKVQGNRSFGWTPPPGMYQVEITGLRTTRTNAGDDMVVIKMIILAGEFQGSSFEKVNVLRSENSVNFLKGDFKAIGVNLPKLSDLPQMAQVFEGIQAEVKVVETQGNMGQTYINTYFQKAIETPVSPQESPKDTPKGYGPEEADNVERQEDLAEEAEFQDKVKQGQEESPLSDEEIPF